MVTILFYATVVNEQILKVLVGSLQEDLGLGQTIFPPNQTISSRQRTTLNMTFSVTHYLELHSAISFSN